MKYITYKPLNVITFGQHIWHDINKIIVIKQYFFTLLL
jgi:hypothetical protein